MAGGFGTWLAGEREGGELPAGSVEGDYDPVAAGSGWSPSMPCPMFDLE